MKSLDYFHLTLCYTFFPPLLQTLGGDTKSPFDFSTIRYRLAMLKIFQKCLIWPQAVFFNEWPA